MMKKRTLKIFGFACAALLITATVSCGGMRRNVVRKAAESCEGKAPGEAVELARGGATVKAVCLEVRGRLVAVPEENMKVCEGKAPGEAVEFTREGSKVKAVCKPVSGRLIAVPGRRR